MGLYSIDPTGCLIGSVSIHSMGFLIGSLVAMSPLAKRRPRENPCILVERMASEKVLSMEDGNNWWKEKTRGWLKFGVSVKKWCNYTCLAAGNVCHQVRGSSTLMYSPSIARGKKTRGGMYMTLYVRCEKLLKEEFLWEFAMTFTLVPCQITWLPKCQPTTLAKKEIPSLASSGLHIGCLHVVSILAKPSPC